MVKNVTDYRPQVVDSGRPPGTAGVRWSGAPRNRIPPVLLIGAPRNLGRKSLVR